MEPSFRRASYGFNEDLSAQKELYRNVLIAQTKLLTQSEFNAIKFTFKAKAEGE